MVASSVPRFLFQPEANLARAFLHRAAQREEAGDVIAAGCLLREAVRRQLVAMCAWYDCQPKNPRRCRSIDLARSLAKARVLGPGEFDWIAEMITTGNTAAHCGHVDGHTLRGGISLLHCFVDCYPCGEPRERVAHCIPADGSSPGDDEGGAACWKGGAL